MYKLMIVDDEMSIRNGMANGIPWEEWGYQVCAVCENGREAIDKLAETQPDVVLSDIRMPEVDGLELMQYLRQNHPQIKIIILSGYSDFEYLNMSIKNQVTDYLLKPTDPDDFEKLFRPLRVRMDKERLQSRQVAQSVNRHFLRWIENLIKGIAEPEDTERFLGKMPEQGLCLENCILMAIELDGRSGDEERGLHKFRRSVAELCNSIKTTVSLLCFLTSDDSLVALVSLPEDETLEEEQVREVALELQRQVRQNLSATISIGLSNLCTEMDMLPEAYEQAVCCAKQNLFQGAESLLSFSQLRDQRPENMTYFDVNLVQKCLLTGDYDGICAEADRVWDSFPSGPVREYELIDQMALSLLFTISLWGLQYNIHMENILKTLGTRYTDIHLCDTLEKKKLFVCAVLSAVQTEMEKQRAKMRGGARASVAYRVREFVEQEFSSNAMSLEYVAEYVHKQPAYISKVFKNELGCNFSDYLTTLRMAKAEEMLSHPDYKIYQIAEECGYADTSNFIKVFRRHTGMSPNEYRSTRRKEP